MSPGDIWQERWGEGAMRAGECVGNRMSMGKGVGDKEDG